MATKLRTAEDDIIVVGAAAHPLRDAYHLLLTVRWWAALGAIAGAFLIINAIFALGYVITGGVEGAREGSFADAFFFSAQTLGTIGYGAIHPTSLAANLLSVVESIVSIMFIAISTGLIFARFSRSTEALMFSDHPCLSLMDDVPTLSLRIGNDRKGAVMDAQCRITMFRTHHTKEGVTMYRMSELPVARERTPVLGRTFTVMHHIDEKSPLFGATPESCEKDEVEILINVVGTDGTSLQPVHGRRRYLASEFCWGARLGDVLSELPNGKLQLDVRCFNDVVSTDRCDAFPYSWKRPTSG